MTKVLKNFLHPFVWLGFVLIIGLHIVGIMNSIYDSIWWFDIFMHGIGGFWVAGSAYIFFGKRNISTRLAWAIILFTLFIGIAWEVFEITIDIIEPIGFGSNMSGGLYDTAGDLIMDVLGAVVFVKMPLIFNKPHRKEVSDER
ncbi:MAG: hypothetical protein R3346_03205 [Candidatus Spechtbacterales bacterium]|nr:hypothetical protein [Candidatus Spechtbacterales bacterium]